MKQAQQILLTQTIGACICTTIFFLLPQFRSISYGLFGTEAYHKAVRRKAVQYLREHQSDFEAFLGDDFNGWLSEMCQNESWGDELTLVSALMAS